MKRHDATTPRRHDSGEPSGKIDEVARRVLDAAFEVHREMGPGFGELAYENAMAVELELLGIRFTRQPEIQLVYKGYTVAIGRMDLLVEGRLVVELKAVDALAPVHTAQVLSYLKASRLSLGLLLNFNAARLSAGVRRIILTPKTT